MNRAATAAVATQEMIVIRVIAKWIPAMSNVASGLGKNSSTVGEQKPRSLGGHSEARTTAVIDAPFLARSCGLRSLPVLHGHQVDRGGSSDDHPDGLDEGGAQPQIDQP